MTFRRHRFVNRRARLSANAPACGLYGSRPLNRYMTKPHAETVTIHTCTLTAEERLLRAIFGESPCCNVREELVTYPPLAVAVTRK